EGGSPDLFVLLGLASTVMGVTTTIGLPVPLVNTGSNPNQIAVSGGVLYILNSGDNNVTAMDVSTTKYLGVAVNFDPGVNPYDFAFADLDGATVMYVTGFLSNTLYEVDPATGKILRKVQ
ncbi:MAG: hypothetical protein GXP54_02100, partial [Deltaproteobacteria bacterium]|nr:hypothetical protein [Deltaproteobacteria bacterium]